MKKILSVIAATLALTILATGVMSGCGAVNSSASAATAGKKTARMIETTMSRLEVMNDSDFNFPTAFGNEFSIQKGKAEKEKTTRSPKIHPVPIPAQLDCPPGVECTAHNEHYRSDSYSRYLERFEDLYVLCVGISVANTTNNAKADAIREEVKELRRLSNELRNARRKNKDAFERFNQQNKGLKESTHQLHRDRNKIRMGANQSKKVNKNAIDVEAKTERNLKLMEKVERRQKLLDETHEKLVKLNSEIRAILEEVENKPKKAQKPSNLVRPNNHRTASSQLGSRGWESTNSNMF